MQGTYLIHIKLHLKQTLFIFGGSTISRRSTKQTIVVTSLNHA